MRNRCQETHLPHCTLGDAGRHLQSLPRRDQVTRRPICRQHGEAGPSRHGSGLLRIVMLIRRVFLRWGRAVVGSGAAKYANLPRLLVVGDLGRVAFGDLPVQQRARQGIGARSLFLVFLDEMRALASQRLSVRPSFLGFPPDSSGAEARNSHQHRPASQLPQRCRPTSLLGEVC